jgi:hypothetical protein
MGSSVADVTRSLGSKSMHRLTELSVDPRELLWGILHTLSQIRGSPSYLFPSLLERCKTVLGLDCNITMGNFLPTLSAPMPDQFSNWAGEQGWDMTTAARNTHQMAGSEGEQGDPLRHLTGVSHVELDFQDCLLP